MLDWTAARFARAEIESARLEAQLLLAHVLRCDRVALYTAFDQPLADDELAGFRELIRRRLAGESVAYLVGYKEFWSRSFKVDKRVLVPRADTEVIIEAVLDRVTKIPQGPLIDVGTGSGAIAITLACELEREIVAVDSSNDALEVASENAATHKITDRVSFVQSDLLKAVELRRFAAVVSNLPYVETSEIPTLPAEVRSEPHLALDGGADGLDLIRRLIATAPGCLEPGGWIFLEHGDTQGAEVRAILSAQPEFEHVVTIEDLAGRERVSLAVKPNG